MAKVGLVLLLLLVAKASIFFVTDAQSCNACNCQFNNVQALSRLVQAEVNRALANEPRELMLASAILYINFTIFFFTVVQFMRISMNNNRQLSLHATNYSTLLASDSTQLAQITISDSSQSYTSNLLAYRPRFGDLHSSGLGAIFVNLEGVFPCLTPLDEYQPICS